MNLIVNAIKEQEDMNYHKMQQQKETEKNTFSK